MVKKKEKTKRLITAEGKIRRLLDEVKTLCDIKKRFIPAHLGKKHEASSNIACIFIKIGIITLEKGQSPKRKGGCFYTWTTEKSLMELVKDVIDYNVYHTYPLNIEHKKIIRLAIRSGSYNMDTICEKIGRCREIVQGYMDEFIPELPGINKVKQDTFKEAPIEGKKGVDERYNSIIANFKELKCCIDEQQKQLYEIHTKLNGVFNRTGSIIGSLDKVHQVLDDMVEARELNSSTLERVTNSFDILVSELPNIKRMAVILANVELSKIPVLKKKKD